METAIIDYGMGNLLSVQRAFEKCGSDAVIIDNPLELRDAERIVLPGVGAFPDAMDNLRKNGWIEELNRAVLEKRHRFLESALECSSLRTRVMRCGNVTDLVIFPENYPFYADAGKGTDSACGLERDFKAGGVATF